MSTLYLYTDDNGNPAPTKWEMERDAHGYRTYKVTLQVETDDPTDGPYTISQCDGLPTFGQFWGDYFPNDLDVFAWCTREASFKPRVEKEPNTVWDCEFNFTQNPTKIPCKTYEATDPLLEPWKVHVSFVKVKEEGTYDLYGNAITNSAFEQIRGPQNEWDRSNIKVEIEQNSPRLYLDLLMQAADHVNIYPMWGSGENPFPPRTVKLSEISVDRKYWGVCFYYWTWKLTFEVRIDTNPNTQEKTNWSGWDRLLMDEGTKALRGSWVKPPGSGGTITVEDVVGTVPTAASVAGAGTGYDNGSGSGASFEILLSTTGSGSGSGDGKCIVGVTTNAAGELESVNYVTGGSNYALGNTYNTTTTGATWLLQPINGRTPDPTNPAHFIKVTDTDGKNMKVWLLDGKPVQVRQGNVGINSANPPIVGGEIFIQKYENFDFSLLGIPADLESDGAPGIPSIGDFAFPQVG
jgi:hypothetical protein